MPLHHDLAMIRRTPTVILYSTDVHIERIPLTYPLKDCGPSDAQLVIC